MNISAADHTFSGFVFWGLCAAFRSDRSVGLEHRFGKPAVIIIRQKPMGVPHRRSNNEQRLTIWLTSTGADVVEL